MRSGPIARLRERDVLRVAASYAVIAWLVLQIADVALEPWDLPGWVRRAPLVMAVHGFPLAIVLAWFFELADGAVSRDAAPDGAARPVEHGWRGHADIVIISVLGAAVAYFVARDAEWLGAQRRRDRAAIPCGGRTRLAILRSGDADALEFHELARDPRFKAQMQRLREWQAQLRERLPETFRRYGLDWPPT